MLLYVYKQFLAHIDKQEKVQQSEGMQEGGPVVAKETAI